MGDSIARLPTVQSVESVDLVALHSRNLGQDTKVTADKLPLTQATQTAIAEAVEALESSIDLLDDPFHFTLADAVPDIATAMEELNDTAGNAPWGKGREITIESGLYETDEPITLSVNNSLTFPAMVATLIRYNGYGGTPLTADAGIIEIADDRKFNGGFVGRGVMRNVEVDGNAIGNTDADAEAFPVHGFYAAEPVDDGIFHTVEYCRASRCLGDGWKVVGRDQFITFRMKAGNNRGWGINIEDVGDSKFWGTGSSGGSGDSRVGFKSTGGALRVAHCATFSMMQFDLFVDEDTYAGPAVVYLEDQTNARFVAGEMSGPVVINGRNYQTGSNEFEINNSTLALVLFKWAQGILAPWTHTRANGSTVAVNAYILIDDADAIVFINPKFGGIDPDKPAEMALRPNYLWQFSSRTDDAHRGFARIIGGSGTALRRSRLGDSKVPAVPFKKNLSNANHLLELDFAPGELVAMRWDDANPPLNYVKAGDYGGDPAVYNVADYPIGACLANWHDPTYALDTAPATFEVPAAPHPLPDDMAYAMRVWL